MIAKPARIFTLLSLLIFFNQLVSQNAAAQNAPQLRTDDASVYTLAAGTVVRVKMDNGITSRSASVGDTFTTTVSAPVFVRSVEVIPAGTVIEGRVVKVGAAKRGGAAGFISVVFETMKLPKGATRKIAGELSDLDSEIGPDGPDGGQDTDTNDVEGHGSGTQNAAFIAGGAGAGAIVGGLAKGGTGAALGGAVGAGVGFLASYFRRGDEAVIKTNAEFGVLLKQSVTLPATDY